KYDIKWNTLAEYLRYLESRGVSCNVASFIGATTIRENVIGFEDKQPTPEQLDQMRELVRKEMEAGAIGIGTSLIYPPAFYAKTDELIELCKVAAKYQGKYISHMRSEGNRLLEALDELVRISREAGIPAELYHIKAAGQPHWGKIDDLVSRIEAARKEGLKITADMYTYTAGGTGLDESLPPWTEDGGYPLLFKRLRDPATREKLKVQVQTLSDVWENIKKELTKPWIAFGSDEASQAPEGVFLKSYPHPRAYGNFARVLGKYVRDEKMIPLAEAIRRLSALPATNLGLDHRGFLQEGM